MSLETPPKPWWFPKRKRSTPSVPYAVPCPCGEVLRGEREKKHQVVTCPKCGQSVFILPRSPLPAYTEAGEGERKPTPSPRRIRPWWLGPVLAGAVSLALVFLAFAVWWPYLKTTPSSSPPGDLVGDVHKHTEAGRQALAEGMFRLALKELHAAVELRNQRPEAFTAAQNRELNQLHRQSDLLARLLTRSLEEIFQQGLGVADEEEWLAQFEDYRGKTVIFDDVVRREQDHITLDTYQVQVGKEKARVALEDLKLFAELPLEPPQRVLFGARLARFAREEGGLWVIRFEPDSGVLLTDLDTATACCPALMGPDLKEVIRRQKRWLEELSVVPPADP
jgi:DNA-directed RNA polymerase subunit RPC12/RpoP